MTGDADRTRLLDLARDSIRHGLAHGVPLPVDESVLPAALRQPRATFVTLERAGELRGCIGNLEARDSLAASVARNAFAAAFDDPRFPPVRAEELPGLDLRISVLSPAEAFPVADEDEAVLRLHPGRDGLVLSAGRHRATFLPAVWGQLPDPRDFLRQLKRKAGLPADAWPPGIQLQRYTAEYF